MVLGNEGVDGSGKMPSASKRRLASSRAHVWILWHAELVSTVTFQCDRSKFHRSCSPSWRIEVILFESKFFISSGQTRHDANIPNS